MTGWECPKCGNVYAPFVWACGLCNTPPIVVSSDTITVGNGTDLCPSCKQHRSQPGLTGCGWFHYGTYTGMAE